MGAARYIGRVGSLAVALGVGTAVATGYGVAAADDTSSTSSSGSSASSSSGGSPSSGASEDGTGPVKDTVSTAEPTTSPAAGSETGSGSASSAAETPSSSSTSSNTTTTVAGGVVVSAQSTTGTSSSTSTTKTPAAPEPVSEPVVTEPVVSEPVSSEPKAADPVTTPKPNGGGAASTTSTSTSTSGTTAPTSSVAVTTTKAQTTAAKSTAQTDTVTASAVTALAAAATPSTSETVTQVATVEVTPAAPAAAPQNPLQVLGTMVSNVVNWALSPFIGAGSTSPAEPPLAWSLLAFVRREFDNLVNAVTGRATATATAAPVDATSVSLAAATTALAAAAVNVPNFPLPGAQLSPSTQFVQWVTGNYQTGNPLIADTLTRFGITGTDVGVIWDNGMVDDPTTPYNEHQVLMAFGDTFSGANMTGNWRFNVLLRSADTVLSDGITIPNGEWFNGNMFGGTPLSSPTTARQIIHPDGLPAGVTLIPTAGISIPTPGTQFGVTQYVNFMSVTNWGAAGTWTTNYSAVAYSTDNGENWTVAPTSVRYNDPWSGNANFQQGAYVRPGDGYVYNYGTPNGRQGAAYVSRVAEKDILDTSKYEYYSAGSAGGWFGWGATPSGWYKNQPAKASAVFGQDTGACGVANPGNQVSEMSVQYNKQLKKYVVLYGDQFNNIVMRTSDTPQGGWSGAKVLMAQQPGGIYAPMMHPWSPSTMGTGTDLYWNLSLWSQYNVMLMKTDLTKV